MMAVSGRRNQSILFLDLSLFAFMPGSFALGNSRVFSQEDVFFNFWGLEVLRDYFWLCAHGALLMATGDHLRCRGSNPSWLRVRHAPLPRCYHSSPDVSLKMNKRQSNGIKIVSLPSYHSRKGSRAQAGPWRDMWIRT